MGNSQQVQNNLGKINISNEVIASVAGLAAMECYGLVGMASRKIKDGIVELLRGEALNKGVEVINYEDGVDIDLYIVVSYGTKISEVAHNIMDKVRYTVEKSLGIPVKQVNIKVQGVRVKE
ncbi:Asp23/Gls24 family envelope stress response protein [Metallumcola ferriviriculae]|uniref:Asp23/Gls24 family envelope stress response protein n=1 Tax=Metallumcola ferriviriculae TaxID=3039180 RepID=A0AAU0UM33_9FIRM|nr:Asp23/Gls24 family envelope stress response protein [Desulfitibacteraceae bacterium MK1]